jgi:sacsin
MRTHKSESLLSKSLQRFQGPALVAYNSGIFEEKDFESIRSLGASRKYTDLTKTGRFGIGFNSVNLVKINISYVSRYIT